MNMHTNDLSIILLASWNLQNIIDWIIFEFSWDFY